MVVDEETLNRNLREVTPKAIKGYFTKCANCPLPGTCGNYPNKLPPECMKNGHLDPSTILGCVKKCSASGAYTR